MSVLDHTVMALA